MTEDEFTNKWLPAYRKQFIRGDEDSKFLIAFLGHLERFSLEDCLGAIADLIADPRIAEKNHPASFPRNHCPLLKEFAADRQQARVYADDLKKRRAEAEEYKRREAAGEFRNQPTLKELAARVAGKLKGKKK